MSIVIPRMQAALEIETELTLQEIAHQIGYAIGLTFNEDVEGIYEEIPALVAFCIGHMYGIYESSGGKDSEEKRRMYLDIRPSLHPADINLKLKDCEITRLDVGDYIAALLYTKAGLTFKVLPPIL